MRNSAGIEHTAIILVPLDSHWPGEVPGGLSFLIRPPIGAPHRGGLNPHLPLKSITDGRRMLKFGQCTVAKKSLALHLDSPTQGPQEVGVTPHWAIQNSITDGDRKLKFGQWTVGNKAL